MACDIFISFRGEDARCTLIGYLYQTLFNFGITTFVDNEKLSIGDRLSEKLESAIEESRISVVVLSENYASSKWCLRELVKIMECKDDGTNRVLPVFYHVDPSDVRHQSGSFKESFDAYELKSKAKGKLIEEKVELLTDALTKFGHHPGDAYENTHQENYSKEEIKQWREAMTKVGNLSGVVFNNDRPEVDGHNKITNQIFDMLQTHKLVSSDRLNSLVDIPNRLSSINNLFDSQSNEVRFIGIVGMGGIGKTTLAQVLYDSVASTFEYSNCCFLAVSRQHDLVSIQLQLLSKLFKKEAIKISDESEGANMIKDRLSNRKVLIVLDGVDETRQLENLAGRSDWFGPKSRIIITTRDNGILRHPNRKVQVYNVKPLDYKSSFSLFCKHAFGGEENLDENLRKLSEEIVEKVEGHPQGLERIGSFLYGQSIDVWREELESLISVTNTRIFNILKISFDLLDTRNNRQAFLDLTCFFNGKSKGEVIEILGSLGYSPYSVLKLLCDRFLIEIKDGGTIHIPNLVQAMGQQIEQDAPQRNRIWRRQEAFEMFGIQHGLQDIKGIVLDNRETQPELELKPNLSQAMSSLKILEIDNVKLPINLHYLSHQLRWLNWHGYPSQTLPTKFEAPCLFQLLLPLAQTTHLWNGPKRFDKLKVIDASDSQNLVETPDLSQVPYLERLVLRNCIRLHTIHNSIISLKHLVLLDLTHCIRLKTFTLMTSLRSHTTLELSGSGLEARHHTSEGPRQPKSKNFYHRMKRMFKRLIA